MMRPRRPDLVFEALASIGAARPSEHLWAQGARRALDYIEALERHVSLLEVEGVHEAVAALEMGREGDRPGSYAHQSKGHAIRWLRRYADGDTP